MPVPTAVPPTASSRSDRIALSVRSTAFATWAAYPENSCPSVTGVASIKCVRPILMIGSNARAFASSAACKCSSAGRRFSLNATATLTCSAVGMMSLDDCPRFTSSLG